MIWTKRLDATLQQFSGAIPEKNGKGLFVTTAEFSSEAEKYAEDKLIILINGQKLFQLIAECNSGTAERHPDVRLSWRTEEIVDSALAELRKEVLPAA